MIMFLKQLLNTIFNKNDYIYDFNVDNHFIQKRELCLGTEIRTLHFISYSAFLYKYKIRELIHLYKFKKKVYLAKVIAKLLYDLIILKIPEIVDNKKNFELVCVPSHYFRVFKRGFNHMNIIAYELSKLLNIRFNKGLLIRSKYTSSLYNKTKQEREKIIKNCFKVNNTKLENKNTKIILIDDILTSGTTIKECIKTLNENGFLYIYPFTVAST